MSGGEGQKMRLLQVGVGGWGYSWASLVKQSPFWEAAGYVDISVENLNLAARTYGMDAEKCFTNLLAALREVDCDAVLVVTPPESHYEIVLECLEAGKHLLVEKPLSTDISKARKMVCAAERFGKKLMVSQNYRFRRAIRTVRHVLESGLTGKPESLYVCFFKSPNFGTFNFRSKMENPLLADMAIHHFDQMRYLLGCNPLKVWARSYNPSWSWFRGDAAVDVAIEFEGGVYVSYCGSWVTRGYETTWDGDWRIECPLGGVHWAGNKVVFVPREIFNSVFNPGMLERDGKMEVELIPMEYEDRAYSLFEFYQAIVLNRDPETSGRDNLYTLALTLGAIKATQVGGWVCIDEIMAQE